MAKLRGMPVPQKAPSLRGIAYVNTWRGIVYLAKWPTKKSRPLPEHTLVQNEWFRQANLAFKYMPAEMQMAFRNATAGTPLYPRDVALMSMAGTLASFTFADGRTLYSMATRRGVNDSLKVLGVEESGVLIMVNGFYAPIAPTAPDQTLVSMGTGIAPEWKDMPPGQAKFLTSFVVGSVNSVAVATKGWYTTIFEDVWIKGVVPYFQSFPGAQYKVQIWKSIESYLDELLYESDPIETAASAFIRYNFPLPMSLKLDANSTYCFLLVRSNGAGNLSVSLFNALTNSKPNFPWLADITPVSFATANPQPEDVLTKGSQATLYNLDLLYSF